MSDAVEIVTGKNGTMRSDMKLMAGTNMVGRYAMFDARDMRFETIGYAWDPANPLSGEKPTIKDLSGHLPPSS